MRAQFLAQDRADLSEAVKILSRKMKPPTDADMKDLKKLARYLVGRRRVVAVYKPQRDAKVLKVHCDSDHAGCLLTRRSTTGFRMQCVKHGSNLQSTISPSSGESEYYALVKAIGMSVRALLEDRGEKYDLAVYSDSSAARGNARRRGLGKLRGYAAFKLGISGYKNGLRMMISSCCRSARS